MRSLPGGALALLVLSLTSSSAQAHEMRPSMLELEPVGGPRVEVRFHVGYANGAPMALRARLPSHCRELAPPVVRDLPPVRTRRWSLDCGAAGLVGEVAVDGLGETGTEVILRTPTTTRVLRAGAATARLEPSGSADPLATVAAYLELGMEHIALGVDHLLFVLGLVLLVGDRWRTLLATVTSFTLGHSVTLGFATLGVVNLPTRAVEAVIAGSIVLLAAELARPREGSWATRWPWSFALGCGLLHGFGFAGALSDVGLPAEAVPSALLGFNLGVELGQLVFVGGVLVVGAIAVRLRFPLARRAFIIHAMGVCGSFWFCSRAWGVLFSEIR